VQIGNFGTSIVAQRLKQGSSPSSTIRLFTTVRGDPSVTWMDFDESSGTMRCGESGSFPRCAEDHRVARVRNDATLPSLTPEPFNMFLDPVGENLFVTHFTTGFVSLFSVPGQVDSTPLLQDILTSLWAPSRTTGLIGSSGVAARPGDPLGLVYVTSRYEARIALIAVAEGPPVQVGTQTIATRSLVRSTTFFLDGIEQSGLPGDSRNLAFSPDDSRAYVVNRSPPSLQLFDTTLGPTGAPANRLLGLVELCEQPANLAIGTIEGARVAAVPCFVNGQVWIIDVDNLRLLATEESGRGPNGIAISTARKKLYVGNYAEDTITVIDLDPASITRNRAILRLGSPRSVED
jgi:DNA-binding beta-propeller fold protein YncE